ncbi:hypothetical protein [Saccharolobus caldissimus]|uniref:Uncharacterized protein n=1 Tax=Saccharolobus caldissimus TaxID=1702097 RepID=A0AAQ4CVV1_9CREN|nr:hypothetical protein [Saccharolobus caldissimus]BDB99932.1 hypothetical protein SACC_29490 [Saccharolobus caldissimus]
MINRRGIAIMTSFAVIYAILELGMRWDPSTLTNSPIWMREIFSPQISLYFYRVIYILIFSYPSYLASGKLLSIDTIWYIIYGSVTEDIVYWILDLRLPYSWAWFYPVYYGLPIDDLIGIILLFILYKQKVKGRIKR